MAVTGDLHSMPLPELLQWLGVNGKTGTLVIERDRVCKTIVFQGGRVTSCSSSDPSELLGHFLVARGQVTEDLLRIALDQQSSTGKHLGMTLVEMGVLSTEELTQNLHAKAEETIFSLFDWEDGIFRYKDQELETENQFPTEIRVEDVLLRGMQRMDEVQRIRSVITSDAVIPERTGKLPPPEVFRNKVARRIYEAIDGDRTVADILLHAHGSVYVVTKFLFELHRTDLIRIVGERAAPAPAPVPACEPSQPGGEEAPIFPDFVDSGETAEPFAPSTVTIGGGAVAAQAAAVAPSPEIQPDLVAQPVASTPATAPMTPEEIDVSLKVAREFMNNGEFEAALEILDRLYSDHPDNDALRRLNSEAEFAFIEKAYKHYLPEMKIPKLCRPLEELEAEDLSPEEFFLLSRIDGTWDVKSIIQVAPIREVDALRTLKKMREKNVIQLDDPE
jgi:hypothetical protein